MTGFFHETEREQLHRFPVDISFDDIAGFFTLLPSDIQFIRNRTGDPNRLGLALQIGALRYLGFIPENINIYPESVIRFVSRQIAVKPAAITQYAERSQTRTEHAKEIEHYLGFHRPNENDFKSLEQWLINRALEHDKPSLLFSMACQRLYADKITRPGITVLERMVMSARRLAQEKTYLDLSVFLTKKRTTFLDRTLVVDPDKGQTLLSWLRFGATSNTPKAILETIEKLDYLKQVDVENWDLSQMNPNRKQFLAQFGRRSTNQSLQRASPEKRYPVLVAFLHRTHQEIIDELIELFDRCLGDCYARAKGDLKRFHQEISKSSNEKIILFRDVVQVVLNKNIPDDAIRNRIYEAHSGQESR